MENQSGRRDCCKICGVVSGADVCVECLERYGTIVGHTVLRREAEIRNEYVIETY